MHNKYISAVISFLLLMMHIPVVSAYSFLGANLVSQQKPDLVISEINFYDETSHINVEVVVLNKGGHLEAKNLLADVEINNDIYKVIDVINSRKETGTLTLDTYEKTIFYFEVMKNELDDGENIFEIEIDSDNHVKESYEQNNFKDFVFFYEHTSSDLPDLVVKRDIVDTLEDGSVNISFSIENIGNQEYKIDENLKATVELNTNIREEITVVSEDYHHILQPGESHGYGLTLDANYIDQNNWIGRLNSHLKTGKNKIKFYIDTTQTVKESNEQNNVEEFWFEYNEEKISHTQIELFAEYMYNGIYYAEVTSFKQGKPNQDFIPDAEVWLDAMYNSENIRCMAMTEGCGWYRMEYSDSLGQYITTTPLYLNKSVRITASYNGESVEAIVASKGSFIPLPIAIDPENQCDDQGSIEGYYDDQGQWREYEGDVITTNQCVYNPFVDVDPNHFIGKAAIELQARNIINGFEDGTYRGDNPVNRAQVTKFLLNGAGYDADGYTNNGRFTDVLEGQWYTKYVSKAAELGIVKGYGDGEFGPENQVLVGELIVMITRAFELEKYIGIEHNWFDIDEESGWVNEYAGIAEKTGMFDGMLGHDLPINPFAPLTRDQVGVAIYRTLIAIENGSL